MNKVCFSPGYECLNMITNTLRSAKKEALLCIFTISDNRIVDAIKEMKRNGVNIRIISDNLKLFDEGSDIMYMAEQLGIDVRVDKTDAHMHHKFAVIDRKYTITGSYNWTRSAEVRNYENVLLTDRKSITKAYRNEFERLWKLMKPID